MIFSKAKVAHLPFTDPVTEIVVDVTLQGEASQQVVARVVDNALRTFLIFHPQSKTQRVATQVLQGQHFLLAQSFGDQAAMSSRSVTLTGEDQQFYIDIDEGQRPPGGKAYFAGTFPDGITKIEGEPASATIRVHYRPEEGQPGDGILVAQTQSNPDGTWVVYGMDPDLKYDVICRSPGYQDRIWSDVTPMLATGLQFSGSFTTLDDQVEILLGVGPYQVDVVGGAPPLGVTFEVAGNFVVAVGNPSNFGQFTFTLRVIDSNGLSGTFESTLGIFDPHWDKVVALLYFNGDLTDETDKVWEAVGAVTLHDDHAYLSGGSAAIRTSDFEVMGIDDFTLEGYFLPLSTSVATTVLGATVASRISWDVRLSSNRFRFFYRTSGSEVTCFDVTLPNPIGKKSHWSVCRLGNIAYGFIDGKLVASGAISGSLNGTPRYTYIGARQGADNYGSFLGDIYSLRISKGLARYSEDFTPPPEPFPNRGP